MKEESQLVTQYETRLVKLDEIEIPFEKENVTFAYSHYGRDYYVAVARTLTKDVAKEHSIILYLAADGSVIGAEIVAIGTESQVIFSTHHIVRTAILLNSIRVAHIHNHPQNSQTACSFQDKLAHTELEAQLRDHHIFLVDSLVITDSGNWSSTSAAIAKDRRSDEFSNQSKGLLMSPTTSLVDGTAVADGRLKNMKKDFLQLLVYFTLTFLSLALIKAKGMIEPGKTMNFFQLLENAKKEGISLLLYPLVVSSFIVTLFSFFSLIDELFSQVINKVWGKNFYR